jgi:hypothetical protein
MGDEPVGAVLDAADDERAARLVASTAIGRTPWALPARRCSRCFPPSILLLAELV